MGYNEGGTKEKKGITDWLNVIYINIRDNYLIS